MAGHLSKKFIKSCQQALLEKRKKLESGGGNSALGDPKTHDFHNQLCRLAEERALREARDSAVVRIGQALKRIEDGAYGVCPVCGKPIPKEKLQLLPETEVCVECSGAKKVPSFNKARHPAYA